MVGWLGMGLVLFAYVLVSFDVVSSQGLFYQATNLFGAIGLVAVSWYKRAYQSAILNIVWAIVAVVALIRILSLWF